MCTGWGPTAKPLGPLSVPSAALGCRRCLPASVLRPLPGTWLLAGDWFAWPQGGDLLENPQPHTTSGAASLGAWERPLRTGRGPTAKPPPPATFGLALAQREGPYGKTPRPPQRALCCFGVPPLPAGERADLAACWRLVAWPQGGDLLENPLPHTTSGAASLGAWERPLRTGRGPTAKPPPPATFGLALQLTGLECSIRP